MREKPVGVDIKLLGGLFLIVGVVGLAVIVLFPFYAVKLFGPAVTGPSSFLVKLHSPAVNLLIGDGFLWLRPWAWGLSLVYAGFGIVSESMNQWTNQTLASTVTHSGRCLKFGVWSVLAGGLPH